MSDLDYLLNDRRSEGLDHEYKAWCDLSEKSVRAEIAKDLAALCNHGGGHIIFGIQDKTRDLQGACPFDERYYSEDTFSDIIKRYLEPSFQIRFEWVPKDGANYAIVDVPSHGSRPVIARSGGPQDEKGRTVGIVQGAIYLRSVGPASSPIRSAEEWSALLERCITKRADLLAAIMRQAIAKPSKPRADIDKLLTATIRATAKDYVDQADSYAAALEPNDQGLLRASPNNFCVQGYALVDHEGGPIELSGLFDLNARADAFVHSYAYDGWHQFLQLTPPERQPRLKSSLLDGRPANYLEGMRLANSAFVSFGVDYWRVYEAGACISAENFREDEGLARGLRARKSLTAHRSIVKLHQVLTHARAMGEILPSISQISYRMGWHGLKGRWLMFDDSRVISPVEPATDYFEKSFIIDWADLRDNYFNVLHRVVCSFLEVFQSASFDPREWLTKEQMLQELARSQHANMRLIE